MKNLVKKAIKGDKDAFVSLMEQQKTGMYKVAVSYLHNNEDVADAIQETILNCYTEIGTLQNPSYFKTWMIRILINNCNDILRKNQKLTFVEDDRFLPVEAEEEGLSDFMDLLRSLDEKYATVLILYYVEGFKIREIAQLLEVPQCTVNSRLQRGRVMVKKEYVEARI